MAEELKLKIRLELSDFLGFQFGQLRKRLLNKLLFFTILIYLLPFCVVFFILGEVDFSVLLSPHPIILLLPGLAFLMFLTTYFASKRAYTNDPQIKKEQEYIFDASGFRFSNDSSSATYLWAELNRFEESKRFFLVYISLTKSYIIPKRLLTATQIISLRNLLVSNVSTHAKKTRMFGWPLRIALFAVPLAVGVFFGLYKDDSQEYFDQGYAKEQQGDYAGAIADFDKAIAEDAEYAAAYNHRGFSKGMLRNYTGELEDCSKSAALKSNGSAYNNMSHAKYNLGDTTGACNDLHTAVSLGYKEAQRAIDEYCPD